MSTITLPIELKPVRAETNLINLLKKNKKIKRVYWNAYTGMVQVDNASQRPLIVLQKLKEKNKWWYMIFPITERLKEESYTAHHFSAGSLSAVVQFVKRKI